MDRSSSVARRRQARLGATVALLGAFLFGLRADPFALGTRLTDGLHLGLHRILPLRVHETLHLLWPFGLDEVLALAVSGLGILGYVTATSDDREDEIEWENEDVFHPVWPPPYPTSPFVFPASNPIGSSSDAFFPSQNVTAAQSEVKAAATHASEQENNSKLPPPPPEEQVQETNAKEENNSEQTSGSSKSDESMDVLVLPSENMNAPVSRQVGGGGVDFRASMREAGDRLVLVLFFDEKCEECKAMKRLHQEFVLKYPEVLFLEANVAHGENKDAARDFKIKFLPTFVAFKNRVEVGRLINANMVLIEDLVEKNLIQNVAAAQPEPKAATSLTSKENSPELPPPSAPEEKELKAEEEQAKAKAKEDDGPVESDDERKPTAS